MSGEQRRKTHGIAARHAAFGSDAVDAGVAARGSKPRRVAGWVIVVNETEIELGLRLQLQSLQRREIAVVGAPLGTGMWKNWIGRRTRATTALVSSTMIPMSFGCTMCSSAGLP